MFSPIYLPLINLVLSGRIIVGSFVFVIYVKAADLQMLKKIKVNTGQFIFSGETRISRVEKTAKLK